MVARRTSRAQIRAFGNRVTRFSYRAALLLGSALCFPAVGQAGGRATHR